MQPLEANKAGEGSDLAKEESLDSKWAYKVKRKQDGSMERLKPKS